MAIISKACKPDNFELHKSLKLSFMNIRGLRLNFVDCESFLESNSPDILALCETNLDDSIDSCNFSVRRYLPLIWNNSSLIHDSHSPALLDFFLSSDASICSTMAFPPLGNSDHVVGSVSIYFPINSNKLNIRSNLTLLHGFQQLVLLP